MPLRDAVEAVIRAWDKHETGRGAAPVIDYDCYPTTEDIEPAASRLTVHRELKRLQAQASARDPRLRQRIDADLTYLQALLGERAPLDDYVHATQGCRARGWSDEYVTAIGQTASKSLDVLGIAWGPNLRRELEEVEGRLSVDDAPDAIREAATSLEPAVRRVTGTTTTYDLTITATKADAYWTYWLDGAGRSVRLRINLRNAQFTTVEARQFALHEVLGHGLQSASLAARCEQEDVPWVRLLSVHAPHQVLLEGLAQALPLFITPDDQALVTRVQLSHYLQLVRSELHLAINSGTSVQDCADHGRARVPFWTDEDIGDTLSDRGNNALLRSYLWAYPAGIDWFIALASADRRVVREVLRAAYRDPLTPEDLTALWPEGPPVGGSGGTLRLRKPALS